MAELAECRSDWRRPIAEMNAHKIADWGAFIKTVFRLRVRQVEPLLQEVDAQHPRNPDRRTAPFP